MAIKTMTKMARTNQKIRAWMISSGYEDITFFPHTRYQKDIHFQGESFDGIASLKNTLVLFQAKTIEKAMKKIDDDFENRKTGGFEFYQILDTKTMEFKEIKMPEREII